LQKKQIFGDLQADRRTVKKKKTLAIFTGVQYPNNQFINVILRGTLPFVLLSNLFGKVEVLWKY